MRYADDILLYDTSGQGAVRMLGVLQEELRMCGLELNPSKAMIFTNEYRISSFGEPMTPHLDGIELPVMTGNAFH